MKTESTVKPDLVERYPDLIRINYDVEEQERETGEGEKTTFYVYHMMEFRTINGRSAIDLTAEGYPQIVAAIVRERYSADDVEAILNNYLADPEGHGAEFTALQEWRAVAKQVAKELINSAQG